MSNNIPCVLGEWISRSWPSRSLWVEDNGAINFDYLDKQFGQYKASVSKFCDDSSFDCHELTISEYIQYWKKLIESRTDEVSESFPENQFNRLPHYLKDWHFARCVSPDSVYQVPGIFTDDWLNRYWKSRTGSNDDYIFSYFGPSGSYTPFHADVFRSYSWSVNLVGVKKWLILYPGEELKLDRNQLNVENQCIDKGLHCKIIYQGAGEGIFVPSGWWHQVLNVRDTISINHNWANFHCVPLMWTYLTSELELVEREIQDCRALMGEEEWDAQCQLVLRANIGLSFEEFVEFVIVNLGAMFGNGKVFEENKIILEKCKSDLNLTVSPQSFNVSYSETDITLFLQQVLPIIRFKS